MGVVVSCTNSKGGVGKTTLNASLAFRLSELYPDKKVLILDQEVPSSASDYIYPDYKISGNKGLDLYTSYIDDFDSYKTSSGIYMLVTGGDFNIIDALGFNSIFYFKENIDRLKKEFDYIIIDTPPTLTKRLEMAVASADLVFTPIKPSALCYKGFSGFLEKYTLIRQRLNPSLPAFPYLFFNLLNTNSRNQPSYVQAFEDSFDNPDFVIKPVLKIYDHIEECVKSNLPVWKFKKTQSYVKKDVLELLSNMIDIIEKYNA